MLDTILFSVNAVAPILLLVLLGYLLRRGGLFNDSFLRIANRLVFRICLPVLLFCNVYHIEGLAAIRWDLVGLALGVVLIFFALGLGIARLWVPDRRQKGVVIQGVFRSNFAIIGLPLATAMGGASGTAVASLLSAFTIPIYNVLAVLALSLYSGAQRPSLRQLLRGVARNPLIWGVLAGLAALCLRAVLPEQLRLTATLPFLYEALTDIAAMASPLALLVLGGQFNFGAIGSLRRQITLGVLGRTVLCPLVGLPIAWALAQTGLLTMGPGEYAALTALFGSPVAVSSAIMAGEMGNDEQLAGQLVVWSSIASLGTLFLTIFLLRQLGFV